MRIFFGGPDGGLEHTVQQSCIMRHASRIIAPLLLLLLAACSGSDAPPISPVLPAQGGAAPTSITHQGSMETSAYDWQLRYAGGRMTEATGTVRDPRPDVDGSYTYRSQLSYRSDGVEIFNSTGEKVQAVLSPEGYIERMTVNRNIYTFHYVSGQLRVWHKTVFEDTFGQAAQYDSEGQLEYSGDDLVRIVFTDAGAAGTTTYTLTPSSEPNRSGLLPATLSKPMGLLGIEHLYYAGLLGRGAAHLTRSVRVSGPGGSYSTTFEYAQNEVGTVLCNYHTPSGGVASVNYSYQ